MNPRPKPKAPHAPTQPLIYQPDDVIDHAGVLWRVHRTTGAHVLPWNAFRRYGPLPSMRWEPHPDAKPGQHVDGVLYTTADVETALAEVFQTTRLIDTRAGAPRLTAWEPKRPLRLLDLSRTWLIRNGAAAALTAGSRATCRSWARAIHLTWPHLDGLAVPSTMTGGRNIVLWNTARDSLPGSPAFSRALADPLVWSIAQAAAERIGYQIH